MATNLWANRRIHALHIRRAPDGSAFQICSECGVTVAIALYDMHKYECVVRKKRFRDYSYDFFTCDLCGVLVEFDPCEKHKCDWDVWQKPQPPRLGADPSQIQQKPKSDFHDKQSEKSDVRDEPHSNGANALDDPQEPRLELHDKPLEKNGDPLENQHHFSSKVARLAIPGDPGLPKSAFRFFMESFEKTCDSDDWFEIDRKGFQKWKDMSIEERRLFTTRALEVDVANEITLEDDNKMPEVGVDAHSTGSGNHNWCKNGRLKAERRGFVEFCLEARIH